MDLGSAICTPKAPDCPICPANAICKGKQSPESYPQKAAKKATPTRKRRIIVWENAKGEWFLEPREGEFLGGLYGFTEYAEATGTVSFRNRAYHLPQDGTLLGNVKQVYSHFKLEADVWRVAVGKESGEGWFSANSITKLALSGADHKVVKLLKTGD